jgi:hypothetical protein
MELSGRKSFAMALSYAPLAPERLPAAAQRIELAWAVADANSTISLHQTA